MHLPIYLLYIFCSHCIKKQLQSVQKLNYGWYMNATENALSELRRQIEANKALLEEQERALMILETMMGYSSKPVVAANVPAPNVPVQNSLIELGELDSGINGDKPTLRTQITEVIERLGDQEFSVAHIDAALKKMGIAVNGKYPRSRISMVLAKLEESGALVKTFTGGGNVPHKYKAVPAEARGLV
jgi:DNA-binding transcriptional ArsR family regulator